MRFVTKRYILKQKCLRGQTGTCLLGTRCHNFSPVHRSWEPQCTASQTDGRTDGRHDAANSRPNCVAVRSAKNENKFCLYGALKSCYKVWKSIRRGKSILLHASKGSAHVAAAAELRELNGFHRSGMAHLLVKLNRMFFLPRSVHFSYKYSRKRPTPQGVPASTFIGPSKCWSGLSAPAIKVYSTPFCLML